MSNLTPKSDEQTKLTAHRGEFERLLAQAIEREHAARMVGAADMQAMAMDQIRALRALLRMPGGNDVAVVVLGASSNPGRFWETRHLFNWMSQKTADLLKKDQQNQQQD